MFEISLSLISLIIGAIASYLVSLHFHHKNENSLMKLNKWLDEKVTNLSTELKSYNNSSKLSLYEDRMNKALEAFKQKGTPFFIIESFNDLTKEEKANMYDQACFRKKGRLGKNPFRE